MRLFSPSMNGFYLKGVNADIPDDAVEISEEKYIELRKHHLEIGDSHISSDDSGNPIVSERQLSQEQVATSARNERDSAISGSMWLCERHRAQVELGIETTLTGAQFSDLLDYHQSLRDWPAQPGWPDIDIPPEPDWMAELKK